MMLNDVKTSLSWTFANIEKFGGNPAKVYLVGVSAGAHLSSLALLTELESHLRSNPSLFFALTIVHSGATSDIYYFVSFFLT